jgi:purine-binding chemotaxis protein CheW
MMPNPAPAAAAATSSTSLGPTAAAAAAGLRTRDVLTFWIGDQLIGLPLLDVRDVLDDRPLTRIPLAPTQVAGALNLRGRIITAIDTRSRLHGVPRDGGQRHMSVVVELNGELYNLIVDRVGDVLHLACDLLEPSPATLDTGWREFCEGVYRLDGQLLVVLNTAEFLRFTA